jgi:hypothetical protein
MRAGTFRELGEAQFRVHFGGQTSGFANPGEVVTRYQAMQPGMRRAAARGVALELGSWWRY